MARSITAAVSHEFTKSAREKGEDSLDLNRVQLTAASAQAVEAIATGTAPYRVTIARKPDDEDEEFAFEVSCECPYFAQEFSPCKHLWAVFCLAEDAGHLTAGAPLPSRAYLDLLEVADDSGANAGLTPARRATPPPPPDPGALALARLESHLREREHAPPVASPFAGRELQYLIVPPKLGSADDRPIVRVMTRGRKKNGEWSKPKPAPMTDADVESAPAADRSILATLRGGLRGTYAYYTPYAYGGADASFAIPAALAPDLLPAIARTGRALVEVEAPAAATAPPTAHNPFHLPPLILVHRPIRWDDGPPWQFAASITRTDRGWRVDGRLERPGEWLDLGDVLAIDASLVWTRDTLARADIGSFGPIVREIVQQRGLDIADAHAPRLALVMAQLGTPIAQIPEDLRVARIDESPRPRLRLTPASPPTGHPTLVAEISFGYAETIVPFSTAPTSFDASRRALIVRRPDEEQAAVARLVTLGLRGGWDASTREPRWELPARQLVDMVQALLPEGWHVEAEGRPFRAPTGVRLSVASGVDWFDLHATVDFGAVTASLSDVVAALARRQQTVLLGDGSSGLLPDEWLRRYLPLAAAGERVDGHLRFRHPQAALLDALLADAAAHAEVDIDAGFRRAREALAELGRIAPVDPPDTFVGTLRDYQREGLAWLQFLGHAELGGCLADDMGLGKTVTVLALLLARHQAPDRRGRPTLIVMPRSLVHNWMQEAVRFAPSLIVRDYSTSTRGGAADFADADVLLATYGTLRRDVLRLKDVELDYVILDEAQAIKNANTASAKAARLLRARHRLALTGTPIENHLGELWSLFEFLNPGMLGRSTFFQAAAGAAESDPDTLNLLARGLRPFILRRTKQQVARELPARTEQTLLCELSKPERALYEQLRHHYRASVLARVKRDGVKRSQMHVLEALLRLRQAACHPALVDPSKTGSSSAKVDVLLSRVQQIVEEGHKALVFSQFTSLLALVRRPLDEQGIRYAYLDGRTRDRAAKVAEFQDDPDCRLFLISLKAGGVGLNLTAAEYVFLLDPWWNPAVEAQAIDRTHRIGQTREVFAYRLVTDETIESKILELQQRKRALADAILTSGGSGLKGLEMADIDRLLS